MSRHPYHGLDDSGHRFTRSVHVRPAKISSPSRIVSCAGRPVFSGAPDTTYPGGISSTATGCSNISPSELLSAWAGSCGIVQWVGAFSEPLDPAKIDELLFAIGGIGWRDIASGFGAGSTTTKLQLVIDPDFSSANIATLTWNNKPAAAGDSWTQDSQCDQFNRSAGAGGFVVVQGSDLTQGVTITGAVLSLDSASGSDEPGGSINACFALYRG